MRRTAFGLGAIATLLLGGCTSTGPTDAPPTKSTPTYSTLPNGVQDKFGLGDSAAVPLDGTEYEVQLVAVSNRTRGTLRGRSLPTGYRLLGVNMKITTNSDTGPLHEPSILRALDANGREYTSVTATKVAAGPLLPAVVTSPVEGWVAIPVPDNARIRYLVWGAGQGLDDGTVFHL